MEYFRILNAPIYCCLEVVSTNAHTCNFFKSWPPPSQYLHLQCLHQRIPHPKMDLQKRLMPIEVPHQCLVCCGEQFSHNFHHTAYRMLENSDARFITLGMHRLFGTQGTNLIEEQISSRVWVVCCLTVIVPIIVPKTLHILFLHKILGFFQETTILKQIKI